MPSKPPDEPPCGTPAGDASNQSKKKEQTKVKDKPSKKYVDLIKSITKKHEHNKEDARKKSTPITESFEVKKKVEVIRPEEDELKRKLVELSSKLKELKSDTKNVIDETKTKISKLETASKKTGSESDPECSVEKPPAPSRKSPKIKIPSFTSPTFLSKLKSLLGNISQLGKRSTPKSSGMSTPGASASRPMKYPYTYSAKIAQFPFKFYIKNNWMWKYYFIAVAVSFPVFYKLGRMSNSPENVKKWEEIRKRDFTPGGHH